MTSYFKKQANLVFGRALTQPTTSQSEGGLVTMLNKNCCDGRLNLKADDFNIEYELNKDNIQIKITANSKYAGFFFEDLFDRDVKEELSDE